MSLPNFVLPKDHTFDWTVKVWVPIDGQKKASKFTATFKHVTPERRLEILQEFRRINKSRTDDLLMLDDDDSPDNAAGEEEPVSPNDHLTFEQDLLSEVMVGFDLKDTEGEPVAFSDQSLANLLAFDPARHACMEAYMNALNGRAPEKNSSGRRKPGLKR